MTHILWIDDEPYFLEGHILALEESGYVVEIVENAVAGLSRLRRYPRPSLVILDVILPNDSSNAGPNDGGSTGIYVLEEIRESLRLTTPVIVLTIVSDLDRHEQISRLCGTYGNTIVRVKPLLPSELVDDVQALISFGDVE